ncbi:hypothetical protein DBV39_19080 [Orrella marina]|uniref:Uncharacterized protein n=1 Tax=Orrella marina TaxID=2163011 RepID=A0A2R4XP08_9BURK|nr:hypothetical protein DBV39_19080 [Orrella marina]
MGMGSHVDLHSFAMGTVLSAMAADRPWAMGVCIGSACIEIAIQTLLRSPVIPHNGHLQNNKANRANKHEPV